SFHFRICPTRIPNVARSRVCRDCRSRDSLSYRHHSASRDEVCGVVILLAQTTVQLPSEAIGDRQPRANLPIILSVQSARLLPYVAVRIPKVSVRRLGLSWQKFLD